MSHLGTMHGAQLPGERGRSAGGVGTLVVVWFACVTVAG